MLKIQDLISADKNGVLFVCVANSARSQMAEGFARFLAPSEVQIHSCGAAPTQVNPHAITAMKEVGVDITEQHSKAPSDVPLDQIAVVVTLCAEAECPVVLAGADIQRIHWPLEDPAAERDEPTLTFRKVREELRELISTLF